MPTVLYPAYIVGLRYIITSTSQLYILNNNTFSLARYQYTYAQGSNTQNLGTLIHVC